MLGGQVLGVLLWVVSNPNSLSGEEADTLIVQLVRRTPERVVPAESNSRDYIGHTTTTTGSNRHRLGADRHLTRKCCMQSTNYISLELDVCVRSVGIRLAVRDSFCWSELREIALPAIVQHNHCIYIAFSVDVGIITV